MLDLLKFEKFYWDGGINHIAGVDEVGRGSLAGPLVACAVILDKNHLLKRKILDTYHEINDSKLISPKKRERLAKFIRENAICYSIAMVEPEIIDKIGISSATQIVFFNTIKNLKTKADHVFTDTFEIKKLTRHTQTNIPSGDKESITVAAASIVAKVYRDSLMVELHQTYDKYGFDKHKGYGTKLHMETLATHGPCEIYRKSFKPVKIFL